MEKTINIGGKEIKLKCNALTPFIYNEDFGKDIIAEMATIQNTKENNFQMFYRLAWVMAKQGGNDVHQELEAKKAIMAWLEEFDDMFAIINVLPEITELWSNANTQTSIPKKK